MPAEIANPFTPFTAVRPELFVDREEEIALLERSLNDTIAGFPRHIAILGQAGVGKTSLLNIFEKISWDKKVFSVIVPCRLMPYEDLTLVLIESVTRQMQRRKSLSKKLMEVLGRFTEKFLLTQFGVIMRKELESRSFDSFVMDFAKRFSSNFVSFIFMFDDIENLKNTAQFLLHLRMLSDDIVRENLRISFAVTSRATIVSELEPYDSLGRMFQILNLGGLSNEAISRLVNKTLAEAGGPLIFDQEAIVNIINYSDGNPLIAQSICYLSFEEAISKNAKIIDSQFVENALKQTIRHLEETLALSLSELPPTEAKVLDAFVKTKIQAGSGPTLSFTEIASFTGISGKSLGVLLRRLMKKGLIRRVSRGRYALSHRAIEEYLTIMKG